MKQVDLYDLIEKLYYNFIRENQEKPTTVWMSIGALSRFIEQYSPVIMEIPEEVYVNGNTLNVRYTSQLTITLQVSKSDYINPFRISKYKAAIDVLSTT